MFHVVCREFELERPKSVVICQHGIDRRFCDSKVTFHPSQLVALFALALWSSLEIQHEGCEDAQSIWSRWMFPLCFSKKSLSLWVLLWICTVVLCLVNHFEKRYPQKSSQFLTSVVTAESQRAYSGVLEIKVIFRLVLLVHFRGTFSSHILVDQTVLCWDT